MLILLAIAAVLIAPWVVLLTMNLEPTLMTKPVNLGLRDAELQPRHRLTGDDYSTLVESIDAQAQAARAISHFGSLVR